MRRPLPLASLLAALLLAAGCGGGSSKSSKQGTAGGRAAPAVQQTGCQKAAAPGPKNVKLPKPRGSLDATKTWTVTFDTNCGSFTVELDADKAPKTSESVAYLVRKGFYDGLTFHRIADGFVIQGGDPRGDGTGGPGYKVHERPPGNTQYVRGVVAMAKAGNEPPGTSGSQFFVVTGENIGLPSDYALVGKVVKGMNTVDKIAAVPHDASNGPGDGKPSSPVVISKATLSSS
jgi:peptidyl-prolyl cis-trans isomerase B (cyclophilin B)